MTNPEKATLADVFRLLTEVRGDCAQINDRLAVIEQDKIMQSQRIQSVEQHAAAFVENSSLIHKRLDDVVNRLDRLERAARV